MKTIIAILSLFLCLLATSRHSAVRRYAEINVPAYMRNKTWFYSFTYLCFITFALDFITLIDLKWYWCILISIPLALILDFVFFIIFESVVHPNDNYVNGRSGLFIWRALIAAFILAIIALAI